MQIATLIVSTKSGQGQFETQGVEPLRAARKGHSLHWECGLKYVLCDAAAILPSLSLHWESGLEYDPHLVSGVFARSLSLLGEWIEMRNTQSTRPA